MFLWNELHTSLDSYAKLDALLLPQLIVLIVVLVIWLFHLLFGMTEEGVAGFRSIVFVVKNPVNIYVRNCFSVSLKAK